MDRRPLELTAAMGEYEDRYPDAYGHGEQSVLAPGAGPARQVRSEADTARRVRRGAAAPSLPPRRFAAPPNRTPAGPPGEIAEAVRVRLIENPFIDDRDVKVGVDGSVVTLDGSINSLIAVSMAHALAAGVDGVSRVEVRLKVRPAPEVRRWPPQFKPPGGS